MENTSSAESLGIDPAADLALLNDAQRTVGFAGLLNFGPWWNAPLLATILAAMTLFNQGASLAWDVVYLAVAAAAGAITTIHRVANQRVRSKFTREGLIGIVVIGVVCITAVIAWGMAVTAIGYSDFVPGYAIVGWLLSTGFFSAIRLVCHRRKPQRMGFS